ncbi:MAG TPA: thioredoxin family protein [Fimbriimonadaceae bacterium]|nr:thioredoxin family protein [Fimbriimonadaceae bacterium]
MKRLGLLLTLLFAMAVTAFAAEPTSAELLAKAQGQAQSEHKRVLVIFHASWCGWCKKLDEFLADPSMGKLMTGNYVIVHLDVQEQGDKKVLENAGGEDLMKQWKGEGLPFSVILDEKGKVLADSNLEPDKSSNIGYPAKPEEIAHFMKMLKTAPRLTDGQRTQIETWLTAHAPKTG